MEPDMSARRSCASSRRCRCSSPGSTRVASCCRRSCRVRPHRIVERSRRHRYAMRHGDTRFLVMTHSHALDYRLVPGRFSNATIRRGSASSARRARARASVPGLLSDGLVASRPIALVCPIGVDGIDSKLPAVCDRRCRTAAAGHLRHRLRANEHALAANAAASRLQPTGGGCRQAARSRARERQRR